MGLSRRAFIKGAAVSTVGAVAFTGCAAPREFEAQSPVHVPEDLALGRDEWFASTCAQCGAGCGIIVRVMDGRVKKIEGNPDFPVNQGKLCPLGQAGPQLLYHAERIKSPMKRNGERGKESFQQVSWDEALDDLVTHLKQLQPTAAGSAVVMISPPLGGTRGLVVDRFLKGLGGRVVTQVPPDEWTIRSATDRLFGSPRLPEFDLAGAQYVLSFGADLFGTWLSPVHYGRGFAGLRDRAGGRGILVQVEPRLSATAAAADEWVPVRPGGEGALALSMAQVIVAEGLTKPGGAGALGPSGAAALDQYRPDRVAQETGVDAQRIADLARAFAKSGASLAIGGGEASAHTNGLFNLSAIYLLNALVGGVGTTGLVRPNPAPPAGLPESSKPAAVGEWQKLADDIGSGAMSAVMLAPWANPIYQLPPSLKMRDALAKAPYIVSFSSFVDESTALADLVLPEHTYLEDWGVNVPDPAPGFAVVGLQQPMVQPFYDTRSFVDVLLTAADKLGGEIRRNLPWQTNRDVVRDTVKSLQGLSGGSVPAAASFEAYWTNALQRGGWWSSGAGPAAGATAPAGISPQPQSASFAGDPKDYPFYLYPFMTSSLGQGRGAYLPWMQAIPEAMTTVTWDSWLEINPAMARRLGVAEGDVVRVESPNGALEVPVYVFPGIPPDVVAIPMGQGHAGTAQTESSNPFDPLAPLGLPHTVSGRFWQGRGVNPLDILAPVADQETGALAWAATRVRLTKTGKQKPLAKFEGVPVPPYTEHVSPVQVTKENP